MAGFHNRHNHCECFCPRELARYREAMVSQVVRRYENWIEGQKRRYGKADGRIDPAGNPDIDEKKANRSRGCAGDRTKQIQLSAKELTKPSFLAARNVVISPVNLRQPSAVKT